MAPLPSMDALGHFPGHLRGSLGARSDAGQKGEEPGWGGRIRTYGTRYQKPLPYHLATPQRPALDTDWPGQAQALRERRHDGQDETCSRRIETVSETIR